MLVLKGGGMEIEVRQEVIQGKIYIIQGHKVMLDSILAELYDAQFKVVFDAIRQLFVTPTRCDMV